MSQPSTESDLAHLVNLLREDYRQQIAKLQAFKVFVHAYLDARGISANPGGPHTTEGCRIGDRMDVVFNRLDSLHRDWESIRKAMGFFGHEAKPLVVSVVQAIRERNYYKRAGADDVLAQRDALLAACKAALEYDDLWNEPMLSNGIRLSMAQAIKMVEGKPT